MQLKQWVHLQVFKTTASEACLQLQQWLCGDVPAANGPDEVSIAKAASTMLTTSWNNHFNILVSFEKSFTQKVLLFLFTWGSASSRFHLEVPARIHVPSAKDSFSCKGIKRETFSGSTLTRNCYCLYHFLLANLSCHVFLQHFPLVCELPFISCNLFVELVRVECAQCI